MFLAAYVAAFVGMESRAAETSAVHVIRVDDVQTTSFDGWGTSLAWWAHAFGKTDDATTLADLCFTTKTVTLQGRDYPGLGMNIVRYNIGGSKVSNGVRDAPTSMAAHKIIPAFLLPPADGASTGAWDWNVDEAQRDILQKAVERGADQVEFFSNSPPWWMCRNGSPAGGDGGSDNLKPGMESVFTDYLATVVEHAQSDWGICVDYIEPFNEPSANWWKFPMRQEGCHFSRALQRQVLARLSTSMHSYGVGNVRLTASDENDIDTARETWKQLGPELQKRISKVNVHAYYGLQPYRGRGRGPMREMLPNRKLWMSEFCDKDASGTTLAQTLLLDINELKADGWCYWQAVDGGVWGLIRANYREHRLEQVNLKYFVFAHLSRHFTAGCSILRSSSPDLAVAWHAKERTIAVVYLTGDVAKHAAVRVEGHRIAGTVDAWSTTLSQDTDAHEQAYRKFTLEGDGGQVKLPATTNTITTLQFRIEP